MNLSQSRILAIFGSLTWSQGSPVDPGPYRMSMTSSRDNQHAGFWIGALTHSGGQTWGGLHHPPVPWMMAKWRVPARVKLFCTFNTSLRNINTVLMTVSDFSLENWTMSSSSALPDKQSHKGARSLCRQLDGRRRVSLKCGSCPDTTQCVPEPWLEWPPPHHPTSFLISRLTTSLLHPACHWRLGMEEGHEKAWTANQNQRDRLPRKDGAGGNDCGRTAASPPSPQKDSLKPVTYRGYTRSFKCA